MKYLLPVLMLLISASSSAQDELLNDFLVGRYVLVGKEIDSNATYTGKVEVYRENEELRVRRTINGQVISGKAEIEQALKDSAKVLRFRYMIGSKAYEETCLWQSDLDNYARISCFVYNLGVHTESPGLEVLFHDQTID